MTQINPLREALQSCNLPFMAEGRVTLLARNLERLLAKHGLSGADVERATLGRVTAADVSRILNGKTADPGFSKIHALADAMGESTDASCNQSQCASEGSTLLNCWERNL